MVFKKGGKLKATERWKAKGALRATDKRIAVTPDIKVQMLENI
jgi:hypothetical protein